MKKPKVAMKPKAALPSRTNMFQMRIRNLVSDQVVFASETAPRESEDALREVLVRAQAYVDGTHLKWRCPDQMETMVHVSVVGPKGVIFHSGVIRPSVK